MKICFRFLLLLVAVVCIGGMTACGSGGTHPDGGVPDSGPGDGGVPDAGQDGGLPSYFHPTGSMTTARQDHAATLLPGGKVLVTGGSGDASAELYDPATGTFSRTGSMTSPRGYHTATLLSDGRVLIAGGYEGTVSAELYDPATGSFTATGSMTTARSSHTATLLNDGKVLIAGGYDWCVEECDFVASAELYDPTTGTFNPTGRMTTERGSHTATLLANGEVLVAGGFSCDGYLCYRIIASAELYDASAGSFHATGSMATVRAYHTATLLLNGKVLIAGGWGGGGSAELYDPQTGIFRVTGSMTSPRGGHTATLLQTVKVLVAGGDYGLASAELYDPATGSFGATGSMATARQDYTATLIPGGKVLVTGGSGDASAELYDEP